MVNRIKNQSGQVVIEFVLLSVLVLGLTIFVGNYFKENQTISSLVSTPWQGLSNVIEHGVWMADASKAKKNSPFGPTRRLSLLTEEVRQ